MGTDPFVAWVAGLETRHLARFEFAEVRKALQALSSVYVERRDRLAKGAALDTDGKRAAFALFYAPLHFLFVREAVRALGAAGRLEEVVDLGCGTAPAAAAWASECAGRCRVAGYERHSWGASEAKHTLAAFGLSGRVHVADVARARPLEKPLGPMTGIVAAYFANELEPPVRDDLREKLLRAARAGSRVLVVEPLSRRAAPYWSDWAKAFTELGGREDEWRFRVQLPDILRKLDTAAGLDHRELGGRTLYFHHTG
jgi:predicted RNA methylase